MEKISGIYCIENTINKKKYIGSSKNVYKRRNRHFSELKCGKHKNCKLQSSYNKHGNDAFKFYVLEEISEEKLLIEAEQKYINDLKPEYNINLIANSSLGVKRSEETKKKVRQANLGLKHPEWRNKIKSEAQGGDNHWTKKKNFSEESKKKMSESQKKLYENGYRHPNRKAIIQFDLEMNFIKEWESAASVEKNLGFDHRAIAACLKGKSKTSNNYIWQYKNVSH